MKQQSPCRLPLPLAALMAGLAALAPAHAAKTTYVVAAGPDLGMDPSSREALSDLERLKAVILNRRPNSNVVVLPRFTLDSLRSSLDGLAASGQQAGRVMVMINAHGRVGTNGYEVKTHEGWKTGRDLGLALKTGRRIDTALLTCHAGACRLSDFPGPVFGLSPAHEPGNGLSIARWIGALEQQRNLPLPETARRLFVGYQAVNKPERGPVRAWWGFPAKKQPNGRRWGMKTRDDEPWTSRQARGAGDRLLVTSVGQAQSWDVIKIDPATLRRYGAALRAMQSPKDVITGRQ